MENTPIQKRETVHIHEHHVADKNVMVHYKDEDRLLLTGRSMINSCKLGISVETWLDELENAIGEVGAWCAERSEKVQQAYLVPKSPQLPFYFVQVQAAYDFDLADEITTLNTNLIRNYNLGMIEMFQIPESELDRFVSVDQSRKIYG